MGSLYKRGDSEFWWVAFKDVGGKRRLKSTGTKDEAEAKKILVALERKIRAEQESGLAGTGPVTVRSYFEKWIARRRTRGFTSVRDDETRVRKHALDALGNLRLADVRPRHLRAMLEDVEKKGLAPRTVRHVYAVLRVMFSDALFEELITSSPCTLKERRGEVPKKQDKDPTWRPTAIFHRDEVERLISDERIPERRRVLYALEFLGGFRVNEITPRRWRDYDATLKPLGKLTAATSYDLKARQERATTKTGVAREVPVHATLATILGHWRSVGWAEHYGRQPDANDLIVPSSWRSDKHMNSTSALLRLHEDCELLRIRKRRQHDARRTFVSLGLADGGRKEILRWVTHPPKDQMDLYTTLPWGALCGEVSKLNIQLRGEGIPGPNPPELSTPLLRSGETRVRSSNSRVPRAGFETAHAVPARRNVNHNHPSSRDYWPCEQAACREVPAHRSSACYVARAKAEGFRVSVAGIEV